MTDKEKVYALTINALANATRPKDLHWYVAEYYSKLEPVDLNNEFRDAGLEERTMHPEWYRNLGPEVMHRSRQYTKDVEARAAMFAERKRRRHS